MMLGLAVVAGCPTMDYGELPSDPARCMPSRDYFEATLWPEYIVNDEPAKTCVPAGACHASGGSGGIVRFLTDPVDLDHNYEVAIDARLLCGAPEGSDFVTRPLGISHGGGELFDRDDEEYAIFLAWFAAP